ncbi:MAG: hypothetical protein E7256_10390 [Lachnospiraceae bacterium]|nr:hypothetical protein [Lachnospiraceae bacterium]
MDQLLRKTNKLFLRNHLFRFLVFTLVFIVFTAFSGSGLIMLKKSTVKKHHGTRSASERLLLDEKKKNAKQRVKNLIRRKYKNLHRLVLSCILRLQQIVNQNTIYIHFKVDYFCEQFLLNKIQYLFRSNGEDVHLCFI